MCTALSLLTHDHYFGRTLDLECSLGESVIITPRRFPLSFRFGETITEHPAIIGAGVVRGGYPLYYDAANEHGLAIAGLNFPGCAKYQRTGGTQNAASVASFELIPWILGKCRTAHEAKALLERTCVCDAAFSRELPPSPLHWMIADRDFCFIAEPLADGLMLHDNPAGVMTNSPAFDYHMIRLRDFMGLSPDAPQNTFAPSLPLTPYSRGAGAMGLPGDWSSSSRFIRAAYLRAHSVCEKTEEASVSQFFHILDAVFHVRGSVRVNGRQEITQYAACCNTQKGVYYYTTYENRAVTAVDLRAEDISSAHLTAYPFIAKMQIFQQNIR